MRIAYAGLALVAVMLGPGSRPAAAQPATPIVHEDIGRAVEELLGQLQGIGSRFREHLAVDDPWERPLITIALEHRAELGLSAAQVETLERLRTGFQREAIRRDADLRVAEMDLAGLRGRDPVDLGQVEAKVREIERVRADLRLARIRAIEQARAQLTPEQREKLRALVADPWPPARAPGRMAPPPPPPPRERP